MQLLLPQIIFYIFAGLTVLTAILVITQNNPVKCVLFLVLTFLSSSVLWMLARAEFLALILVLVYVGAVMTLFLFVVMMLNIEVESKRPNFKRYFPLGIIVILMMVTLLFVAINSLTITTGQPILEQAKPTKVDEFTNKNIKIINSPVSNTEQLGLVLYTDYLYAFEIAAVILLVAIIAAISLVHRNPIRSKQQNIVAQIMTRKKDRITLIKMKPENSENEA